MDDVTKEALRYLGCGEQSGDEVLLALIQDCFTELSEATDFRYVYKTAAVQRDGRGIHIGPLTDCGQTAARFLSGCARAVVLVATLGGAADRLLRKYSMVQVSKAVVLQACMTARLEACTDEALAEIWAREKEAFSGLVLLPRCSPGYGDFPIELQPELLDYLDAGKRIGVKLTKGGMMMPLKSVTAVAGIGPAGCLETKPCTLCEKEDCLFRKENYVT